MGSPVDGVDRLAEIQARVEELTADDYCPRVKATNGEEWCIECASEVGLAFVELRRDVLALVEIARAAQGVNERTKEADLLGISAVIGGPLRKNLSLLDQALARLDSGATEGDA